LEPLSLLSWSPCGSYLFTAHSGSFRVWETRGWRSATWVLADAPSDLVAACWSPDGRTLVLAHAHSVQLTALHFTAEAPALTAQVLPLVLPGLSPRAFERSEAGSSGAGTQQRQEQHQALISAVAWDSKAQRLAVGLGRGHPAAGCVALYDTRCDPIITARLLGLMRVQPMVFTKPNERQGADDEAAAAVTQEINMELQFHSHFEQGALLAVKKGPFVGTVGMYFTH
jgi:hypothetical protein